MAKKKTMEKIYWIPINMWNLNELFTTESISPISFYKERNFGNPVSRNQERIEDKNNLILFDGAIQSDILLNIKSEILDTSCLKEIKVPKGHLKSFEYSKTIYLKKGFFNVCFCSEEKQNEFLNNTFMLLEVKTVNKYKDEFTVNESISDNKAYYVPQLLSDKNEIQPYFDKALNQVKGLIHGYLIGSIGTLAEKEQKLVTELSKLKNTIGGVHTDIALAELYTNFWLVNIRIQISNCQKLYFENFGKQSDVLDTLLFRLVEIDKLNQMRCAELLKQKKPNYKRDYEIEQEILEKANRKLYKYEFEHEIIHLNKELEKIKQEEKSNGERKGRSREYYKIGTEKYDRKQELKHLISKLEGDDEYQNLKREVDIQAERLRNFQFGFTQYDTSITEQFSRISEHLHEITKKATNYFLSRNNNSNDFPDISFEISIAKIADYYFNHTKSYTEFSVVFPKPLSETLTETELQLLSVSVNSILSRPQGRLGDFSEQNILEIMIDIGEHLPENPDKQTLRDYYLFRTGKSDSFSFPENSVIANVIVFLMKNNGHDQINKMLVANNVQNRQISFLLYGAYFGFANLPKTFTNIVFDSGNTELFNHIDNYLFNSYINLGL